MSASVPIFIETYIDKIEKNWMWETYFVNDLRECLGTDNLINSPGWFRQVGFAASTQPGSE